MLEIRKENILKEENLKMSEDKLLKLKEVAVAEKNEVEVKTKIIKEFEEKLQVKDNLEKIFIDQLKELE